MTPRQQSIIYHTMNSLGLPKRQLGQVLSLILFWERVHGLAWLVSHMKLVSRVIQGYDASAVSTDKNGLIKGPFKPYHANARRSRAKMARTLNALKFIYIFKATPKLGEYKEHADALFNIPLKSVEEIYELSPAIARICSRIDQNYKKHPDHFNGPFLPAYEEYYELRSCADIVNAHWSCFKNTPLGYAKKVVSTVPTTRGDFVGQCKVLYKDGALKRRFVYSPWRVLQYVLEPLYYALDGLADELPQLYHKDQEAGKLRVVELMWDQECVSVDLKSATDMIPSLPQFLLLHLLFPSMEKLINLARDISYGRWVTPEDNVYVQHLVGQPMGLKFSFLLFSIYLYFLLIEEYPEGNFAIVGDDLVLPEGGSTYVQDLGLTISKDKTIGGDFNEFCGSTLDLLGDLGVKRLKNLKQPLSLVSRFGKRIVPLFSRQVRKVVLPVANLPAPVGIGRRPKSICRLPDTLVADLYYPANPFTKIPLFPRSSRSYRSDLRYILSQAGEEDLKFNPIAFLCRARHAEMIEAQCFGRVSSLLCVIEGINETRGVCDQRLLENIYGIPPGWESTIEYPTAPVNPWKTKEKLSDSSFYIKDLLMTSKIVGKYALPDKTNQAKLSGMAQKTSISSGCTCYSVETTADYSSCITTNGTILPDPSGKPCCILDDI